MSDWNIGETLRFRGLQSGSMISMRQYNPLRYSVDKLPLWLTADANGGALLDRPAGGQQDHGIAVGNHHRSARYWTENDVGKLAEQALEQGHGVVSSVMNLVHNRNNMAVNNVQVIFIDV
jgi:hypothetical protein